MNTTNRFPRVPTLACVMSVAAAAAISIAAATAPRFAAAREAPADKPTVVLVHGAFAESSSWNAVTGKLLAKGYRVVAVANPLRGLKFDANYTAGVIDSVRGGVILVGHSYGGSVITNAATGKANVKALVFVSGLAPDAGESAASISDKFPGSTLGPTLAPPVALADGGKDLYIAQDKFHAQFAADLPAREARLMAVTQRPVTEAALNDPSDTPAWKTIPSWFLYGSADRNITPAAHAFMARRAGAKKAVEIKGASHVVMASHPDALVKLIDEATAATSTND